MATGTNTEEETVHEVPVSTEEIIGVSSGISGDNGERRVWAASASDRKLRRRLAWALPPEDEADQIADAIAEASPVVSERLRQRMMLLTEKFGTERKYLLPDRLLDGMRTLLSLPCFSPAYAASEADSPFVIASQTIETGEGVRVVFQQLPPRSGGDAKGALLRVIVDATALSGAEGYTSATVNIGDDDGAVYQFSVPLNQEAKGLLDVADLPLSASPRRLVAVLLSAE